MIWRDFQAFTMAVESVRRQTISQHNKLVQQLEDKYRKYIDALLQQKAMILMTMQKQLIEFLDNLNLKDTTPMHIVELCGKDQTKITADDNREQNQSTERALPQHPLSSLNHFSDNDAEYDNQDGYASKSNNLGTDTSNLPPIVAAHNDHSSRGYGSNQVVIKQKLRGKIKNGNVNIATSNYQQNKC